MEIATREATAGRRPRGFVGVRGSDAESYLQRMVSNDVAALEPGASCAALLLTAKARVIAPMVVFRRGRDDFLLLTEPELGATLRNELLRFRFAAKVEIEPEEHDDYLLLAGEPPAGAVAVANDEYGARAWEVLDSDVPGDAVLMADDELEALRIRAGVARFGKEIDERVLPAEAGLVDRAVSFTKGCYPGQEPIARLQYRGHANRGLRRLLVEGERPPPRETPVEHEGREVGRVTSAVRVEEGVVALAYVRTEVPAEAVLTVGSALARQL
jgi:folate-binding protein YgfZ